MVENPATISSAAQLLFVARNLERIGDHAKNIAEHVVYLVEGTDIRHGRLRELEESRQEQAGEGRERQGKKGECGSTRRR